MKRKNLVALMLLVGILLAAVVFAPVPGRTLGIRTLHDFAHAPIFGCVALLTLFAFGAHPKFSKLALRKQQALPEQWANRSGEYAMRVTFAEGPWPGVDFSEPAPDWRGYTNLAIDITNPSSAELVLGLRVHDAHHDNRYEDRFNRTLNVPPLTRTVLRIPIADIQAGPQTRAMDLKQIADYLLFGTGEPGAREMYVGRVWLE